MPTPCDMQSLIVWMVAGIAERETGRKAMRRWREPREMVGIFVAHPMKTGRRRCTVYQPSVPIKSDSESLAAWQAYHVASTHNWCDNDASLSQKGNNQNRAALDSRHSPIKCQEFGIWERRLGFRYSSGYENEDCACIPRVYPLADARAVTLPHNNLLQYALNSPA
jgi:hypothetical protein